MPINMEFISVKKYAEEHELSECTVRNYCKQGKFQSARLIEAGSQKSKLDIFLKPTLSGLRIKR